MTTGPQQGRVPPAPGTPVSWPGTTAKTPAPPSAPPRGPAGSLAVAAVVALLGAVPLVGDAFDVAWKANDWNMRLLERHAWEERAPSHGDWLFVIAIALAMLAVIAIPLVTLWFLLRWLAGGPA